MNLSLKSIVVELTRWSLILILLGSFSAQAQRLTVAYDTTFRSTYYEQKVTQFRMLPDTPSEIIFLGNSITDMGEWAEIWQNPKVKNRGISSDLTYGVLNRLDEVVSSKPAKVFIMIGINDIARNIPDSIILSNHTQIIQHIKKASPETQIYLQSLLPTNSSFTPFKNHQNKTEHILAVNKGLRDLARDERITYVDLYSIFTDATGKLSEKYTNDGLHLTGPGFMLWKELLSSKKYCF